MKESHKEKLKKTIEMSGAWLIDHAAQIAGDIDGRIGIDISIEIETGSPTPFPLIEVKNQYLPADILLSQREFD